MWGPVEWPDTTLIGRLMPKLETLHNAADGTNLLPALITAIRKAKIYENSVSGFKTVLVLISGFKTILVMKHKVKVLKCIFCSNYRSKLYLKK